LHADIQSTRPIVCLSAQLQNLKQVWTKAVWQREKVLTSLADGSAPKAAMLPPATSAKGLNMKDIFNFCSFSMRESVSQEMIAPWILPNILRGSCSHKVRTDMHHLRRKVKARMGEKSMPANGGRIPLLKFKKMSTGHEYLRVDGS
jgi:hypothetical protein